MTLLDIGARRGGHSGTGVTDPVNKILKIVYEGAVRDTLNNTTTLDRLLNKDLPGVTISGEFVRSNIRTKRNVGFQYIPERAKLPKAGKQTTEQVDYRVRYLYGRARVTGQLITATAQSRGAFIDSLDFEINGLALDMHHGQQRVNFGDGTGALCQIAVAVAATTDPVVTVKNPGGITSTGLGTQYMEEGMRVCVVDAENDQLFATPTMADLDTPGQESWEVTAVDYNAGTVTLDTSGNLSLDVDDYMYLAIEENLTAVTWDQTNRGQEPFGLAAVISDADPRLYTNNAGVPAPFQGLGNLPVASAPTWKAYVLHNSGTPVPFTETMLQKAIDGVRQLSNGRPKYMVTTYGIRRQFAAGLISQRRYPAVMDFQGGFRAVSYDGIPMIVDKDCTKGRIYGIDPSTMAIAKEKDWGFLDKDGRVLQKVPDYDQYEVTICAFQQLVCTQRNANFQIRDIQDV